MNQHIRESNLIEGIDDRLFDTQAINTWDYLKSKERLTNAIICEVQQRLTLLQTDLKDEWRGAYRKIDVWVGGRKGADVGLIRHYMNNWLIDVEAGFDPKLNHIAFEKIHPFVDGNGRTGRMLMWWQELKLGKEPTLILNATKQQDYYTWFREAENE